MRVALFALLAFLACFVWTIEAQAQCPIPIGPPRAALIRVSTPDANNDVMVTGAAGAVVVQSASDKVVLVNLDTGHFAAAQPAPNGSFSAPLFAPAGSSILVKLAPDYVNLPDIPPGTGRDIDSFLLCLPGTILHVPEPPATGGGVPFSGTGPLVGMPAWTFQGTLNSRALQPGDTLQVKGTFRMVSPVFRTASDNMQVRAVVEIERLAGPDGSGALAQSIFASTTLTPTGFPIERHGAKAFGRDLIVPFRVVADSRAEAALELSYQLPSDLPPGYYRPFIGFTFNHVPPETPTRAFVRVRGRSKPINNFNQPISMYLPIVRVGAPAAPRLYWTLLLNNLSNGSRGVGAIEDRNRFGGALKALTQSETFIIPRVDPVSGRSLTYRLEPFALTVNVGDRGGPPNAPLIPFRFPSGRLTVRVRRPDGAVSVLGPAPFVQNRMDGIGTRDGFWINGGGGHIGDAYQLSTMDPRFDFQFTQDGLHVITVEGTIDDVWGTIWSGGGTYEVYVARPLSLDTTVLPGTPFEVGDSFNSGLTLTPPLPAQVEMRFQLAPNSDPSKMTERVVRGQTTRFGYFQPAGAGIVLDQPGEYRVDVIAAYRDQQGRLWMGSRTWGGVVAPRNPAIIAHGRRGIDQQQMIGPQWFFRSQTGIPIGSSHVHFAFHSGDVMWLEKTDAVVAAVTFQDTTGTLVDLLRSRALRYVFSDERAAVGEIPLYSSRPDGLDPHLDLSRVDLWGYGYSSVQRPLVRVREQITEDGAAGYWRFSDLYALQIGMGQSGNIGGDLPNDFKFQYGAAVLRGAALPQPHYAIYGSQFVLVPDGEPGGGTRVFPPFQGNGGGPNGGPIMKLKGQDIDLFIHLTGVRPGSVLEVGDNFSIAGAVGPPLPALVGAKVTTPSGRAIQFLGRANRVGYYYRPQDDFAVTEPGIYTVDVRVTFDGQTSAGRVTEPFPTGDVLGSANGRFFIYVVPRESALLTVNLPETMTVALPTQLDITARAPAGLSITSSHVATMMPGFLLQTNSLSNSAGSISYRYDPETLARDFPNLDFKTRNQAGELILVPPGDVITISLFGQMTNAQGQTSYAARVLALHGQEFFNLAPTRAPARAVASVSAASYSGAALASESIVAAFGAGLAITTQVAATVPLPTLLAGTTINVKDSTGAERLAPLFFVSPGQVNYQMPPGTAPGSATVTITNRYGDVSAGAVRIAAVAPGLFAANANGQGVAAALALRVKADGTQQFEPVSRFDPAQNRFVSAPIDLGPETDQVFLILFGTGLRFNSGLSATRVSVGGVNSEALFAGATPGFVGLDQANVRLSRSLIGRGEVEIRLTADGQPANPVTVSIK